jgi:hypothetical protein
MSMRRILLVAAAAACVTGFANSASATVMIATYTGTVTTGQDLTGEFGSQADLSGLSYVATFRYDTALGDPGFSSPPGFDDRMGGSNYWLSGFASPILAATLTLEGVTRSFSVDSFGDIETAGGTIYPTTDTYGYFFAGGDHVDAVPGGYRDTALAMSLYTPDGAASLDAPYSGSKGSVFGPNSTGQFEIIDQPDGSVPSYNHYATATLSPETVSIVVATVPEPGSWALMLAGFAGLGVALRRQRRGAPIAI